jgi:molybdate transport system regulatory protein
VEIKSRIWLEQDGLPVFGSFRARVLKAIRETGSINKAAGALGVSYRKVWGHLRAMEERLPQPLLVKNKGGKGGGGARLTDYAVELLNLFNHVELQIRQFTDNFDLEAFSKNPERTSHV